MSVEFKINENKQDTVNFNVSPFQYLPDRKITNPDERLEDVITKFKELYSANVSGKKNEIVVLPESLFKEIYIYDRRKFEKEAAEKANQEIENGSSESESALINRIMQGHYERFIAWEKRAQEKIRQVIKDTGVNAVMCGTDYDAVARFEKKDIEDGGAPQHKFVNGAFFVNSNGEILHTYHKQNYVPEENVDYYIPGDRTVGNFIFETNGKTIPMGLIICADAENPQVRDKLLLGKPSLVLNPANCSPDGAESSKTWLRQSGESSKQGYINTNKPISDVVPVVRAEPPEPICNGSSMFLFPAGSPLRPEFPYGNWTPIRSIQIKSVPREEALQNLESVRQLDLKQKSESEVSVESEVSSSHSAPEAPPFEASPFEAPPFDAPSFDAPEAPALENDVAPPPAPDLDVPSPPPLILSPSSKKQQSQNPTNVQKPTTLPETKATESSTPAIKPPPLPTTVTVRAINAQDGSADDYLKNFLEPIARDQDKHTLNVVTFDFDGTFNYFSPEALSKPKAQQKGEVLGGTIARKYLKTISDNGGVLKIISAANPSPSGLDSVNVSLKKLDAETDGPSVCDLFCDPNFTAREQKKFMEKGLDATQRTINLTENDGDMRSVPMVHFKNVMLPQYEKGAALVESLREKLQKMDKTEREQIRTIKVHFLDDFVRNPYEVAQQFLGQVKTIEAFCPKAKIEIDSVWLQIRPPIKYVKGSESSYTDELEHLRHNTTQIKNMSAEEFMRLFSTFESENHVANQSSPSKKTGKNF